MNLIKIKIDDALWNDSILIRIEGRLIWYSKCSIKTLENKTNISWYYHRVFKKIKYVWWDTETKQESCRVFVEEKNLYNKRLLKKLADSNDFKNRRFAFFFYGEVQRLLGIQQTEEGMSGLFG